MRDPRSASYSLTEGTNAHTDAFKRENPMCPFLSIVWVVLWESPRSFLVPPSSPSLSFSHPPPLPDKQTARADLRVREQHRSSRTNILLPRSKKNVTAITLSPRIRNQLLSLFSSLSLSLSISFPDNAHLFFRPIDWSELKATRAPAAPSRTTSERSDV